MGAVQKCENLVVELQESTSRKMLKNAYLGAKIGLDTAAKELSKICPLSVYRSPRSFWLSRRLKILTTPRHINTPALKKRFRILQSRTRFLKLYKSIYSLKTRFRTLQPFFSDRFGSVGSIRVEREGAARCPDSGSRRSVRGATAATTASVSSASPFSIYFGSSK